MVLYRVAEAAGRHALVRYADTTAGHRPRKNPPKPPSSRGTPASLDREAAGQPWRSGEMESTGNSYAPSAPFTTPWLTTGTKSTGSSSAARS